VGATLASNARKAATIMSPRRWAWLVAAVELACGVGVAAYFVVLGLTAPATPDRTGFDRVFPFALTVLGLVLLGAMAWRSVRRARNAPQDAEDRGGFPGVERQRGPHAGTPRVPPPGPRALSGEGRAELARVVRVLADAGVLARPVPDPGDLEASVADAGEPVTAGTVLGALTEREHDLEGLAFHDATASSSSRRSGARSTTSPASSPARSPSAPSRSTSPTRTATACACASATASRSSPTRESAST
jgi:hypothetical protein